MLMRCIFSVDVEDWFHILDIESAPKLAEWDSLPSRVEKNFLKLLDIFENKGVSVTCFFLGWVAQQFPNLIKEASFRGHEVASHGYSHCLAYKMTATEFFKDAVRSKDIIENISGKPVLGFRAAGFSVTQNTPWYFDKLIEAGYIYDSSVFPASREHGGLIKGSCSPYIIKSNSGRLIEFPVSIKNILGIPICFFGGGYLRIFPYRVIKKMAVEVLQEGRPVVFYVHPREIDPQHPRLKMSLKRKIKSYININTTAGKVLKILEDFNFYTFEKFISENKLLMEN